MLFLSPFLAPCLLSYLEKCDRFLFSSVNSPAFFSGESIRTEDFYIVVVIRQPSEWLEDFRLVSSMWARGMDPVLFHSFIHFSISVYSGRNFQCE